MAWEIKTRKMTKRQTQQAKNQEKSKSNQRLENNQRLAYPRLRREAQHKSLGGSPEKQPKNQDAIILTIILLLYPTIACELAKSTLDTKTKV